MHSRVFVLATKNEILSGDFEIPAPDEVVEAIPWADYVSGEAMGEEISKDIEWFKGAYGENTIERKETFLTQDEEEVIGYKINKEVLLKKLEENFDRILTRVKGELELWSLKNGLEKSYVIENIERIAGYSEFYFFLSGWRTIPETGLYYALWETLKDKDVYIIATIDYHM